MQRPARLQQEDEGTQQTDQGTAGHSGTRPSTREDLVGVGRSRSRMAIGGHHRGLVVGDDGSGASGDGGGGGSAVRMHGGNLGGLGGRRVTMYGQFPDIHTHPVSHKGPTNVWTTVQGQLVMVSVVGSVTV